MSWTPALEECGPNVPGESRPCQVNREIGSGPRVGPQAPGARTALSGKSSPGSARGPALRRAVPAETRAAASLRTGGS